MIKLTQCTPTGGDCTAGYSVKMDKEYTVKEFVDEILKNANEWGYIGIFKEGQAWYERGTPHCEFRRSELITKLPDEIMDKIIVNAKASGGWSRMDYLLTLI